MSELPCGGEIKGDWSEHPEENQGSLKKEMPGESAPTRSLFLSPLPSVTLFSYFFISSIQGALLAGETYVNIAKGSEVDNIQK